VGFVCFKYSYMGRVAVVWPSQIARTQSRDLLLLRTFSRHRKLA